MLKGPIDSTECLKSWKSSCRQATCKKCEMAVEEREAVALVLRMGSWRGWAVEHREVVAGVKAAVAEPESQTKCPVQTLEELNAELASAIAEDGTAHGRRNRPAWPCAEGRVRSRSSDRDLPHSCKRAGKKAAASAAPIEYAETSSSPVDLLRVF